MSLDRDQDTVLDQIEKLCNVNIEVSDADGNTHVYTYTNDGDRIGFHFYSMNPDAADVLAVSQAIDQIRVICNKRPRVGLMAWSHS